MPETTRSKRTAPFFVAELAWTVLLSSPVRTDGRSIEFQSGDRRVLVELLDDALSHLAWLPSGVGWG